MFLGMKPRSNVSTTTLALILAVILALAAVAGTLTYVALTTHPATKGTRVIAEAVAGSPGTSPTVPVSGASVEVYAMVPTAANFVPDVQGVPAQELLLWQGTTGANGVAEGVLSPEFASIASAWTTLLSIETANVSLYVMAFYTTYDSATNTTNYYTFTNFISYSPWSPPAAFDIPVAFALAHPAFALTGNLLAPVATVATSEEACPASEWENTTSYSNTFTGDFPMFMINNTYRNAGGAPNPTVGEAVASSTTTMDFTGAGGQIEKSGSTTVVGATMTTGASWSSGSTTITFYGSSTAALASSQYAFGVLYIPGVTVQVLDTYHNETLFTGPNCLPHSISFYNSEVSISNVQSLTLYAQEASSAFGEMLTQLEDNENGGLYTITNQSVPEGQTAYWTTWEADASGYSDAESEENSIVTAESEFDAALGVGLAVMELQSDACGWFCTGSDIAPALDVFDAALGAATVVEAAINSVSFSTSVSTSFDTIGVSSNDAGFYYQAIGAATPTTLTAANGQTYDSANMPSYIVAWEY